MVFCIILCIDLIKLESVCLISTFEVKHKFRGHSTCGMYDVSEHHLTTAGTKCSNATSRGMEWEEANMQAG